MDKLASIKATAMNRGKPRIWLSERDLTPYGFQRYTAIKVTFLSDCIIITADNDGGRVMNGRTSPKGKHLQLLDMTCSQEVRESIRMGCAKFQVYAEVNRIVISADFDTRAA
jgi:hypothetical protein